MSTVTPTAPTLIIVSGLSGSGKSVALKTFEDQDYYCSDNLPIQLLPDFVRSVLENHDGGAPRRLAVGIDVRGQADLSQLGNWRQLATDRKITRANSSHLGILYGGFCLKKKIQIFYASRLCSCIHPVHYSATSPS